MRPRPESTLFPYTTLFRSLDAAVAAGGRAGGGHVLAVEVGLGAVVGEPVAGDDVPIWTEVGGADRQSTRLDSRDTAAASRHIRLRLRQIGRGLRQIGRGLR